ncbi:MAG TPA: hypothetical protein VNZ54_07115 [bacterium]|nr:hypothetical protein [bacterium]
MTGAQKLLQALRNARACTAAAGEKADAETVSRQENAVASLKACLDEGLPRLQADEAKAVAEELRQLLLDNRYQMRWAQIRARLARIGTPGPSGPVPAVQRPRLDITS